MARSGGTGIGQCRGQHRGLNFFDTTLGSFFAPNPIGDLQCHGFPFSRDRRRNCRSDRKKSNVFNDLAGYHGIPNPYAREYNSRSSLKD
jgi:hypothetical protein